MTAPRRVLPDAPSRRGWCPSLARPMPTGDGLLARIHPPLGRLTPAQARAVAEGARRFGNGHIDVTARANLQVRGVTDATRCGLADALAAAGLGDTRTDGGPQRLTLTTPLAGLGRDAIPALARAIEDLGLAIPGLPAKTLVAVESALGGLALGAAEADLHLVAGPDGLALHLAGDACWWGLPGADPRPVVEAALRLLAASGQRRMRDIPADLRAKGLDGLGLRRVPAPSGVLRLRPGLLAVGDGSHASQDAQRPSTVAGASRLPSSSREGIEGGEGGIILDPEALAEPPPHPTPPGENARSFASRERRGSPLLEREGQGEVGDLSGNGPHLTPALSFQEREQRGASHMGSNAHRYPAQHASATTAALDETWVADHTALLVDAPFGRCTADALDRLAAIAERLGPEGLRLSPTRGFLLVGPDSAAAEGARAALGEAGFLTRADDPRGAVAACPGAPACASGSTPTLLDAARLAEAFRPFAARGLRAHVSGCAKGCAHPGAADLTLVGRDGRYDVIPQGRPDGLPATRLPFEAALDRVRSADSAACLTRIFSEIPPGPPPS